MIGRRKLLSLPRETRLRKIIRLLLEWELSLKNPSMDAERPPLSGMAEVLTVLRENSPPGESAAVLDRLISELVNPGKPRETFPWDLNLLRHILMRETGMETADWDYRDPLSGRLDASVRRVLPCRVYIDGIRSPFNIGSIFRTAECFGVKEIIIAPGTASPEHRRARRTAMGSIDAVPWRFDESEEIMTETNSFALETGGTPINKFAFPPEGICIVGSEELGVRPALRGLAEKNRGTLSIPLFGAKGSLNVSVAFGILMQAWSDAIIRDF